MDQMKMQSFEATKANFSNIIRLENQEAFPNHRSIKKFSSLCQFPNPFHYLFPHCAKSIVYVDKQHKEITFSLFDPLIYEKDTSVKSNKENAIFQRENTRSYKIIKFSNIDSVSQSFSHQ